MQAAAVRAVRDAERIERIRTPVEARVRVVLYTAPLCRAVRKDYHIVSAKMFLARGEKVRALSEALREAERACVEAQLYARRYRGEYGVQFPPQSFELRVVSPFAHRYLRAILELDPVNLLLLQAETRGVLARRERMEIVRPCLALLFEVKRIALDLPEPQGREDENEDAPEAAPRERGSAT